MQARSGPSESERLVAFGRIVRHERGKTAEMKARIDELDFPWFGR